MLEELAGPLPDELRLEYLRESTARLPRPYRLSPSRVAAVRHQGLTAREREVAGLIARGMSNREIAAALVVGERTVETHVTNILAKLGVGSRREVAAWASARGLATERV
jgi:DNA-binding NarL/FixJ family response regulator